jgi:hypothetical protein
MRHANSTVKRLNPNHTESPIRDRTTREAQAWLLSRLRWEHRLAELHAEHQGART